MAVGFVLSHPRASEVETDPAGEDASVMGNLCYVDPPELNYSPTPSLAHPRAVKRRLAKPRYKLPSVADDVYRRLFMTLTAGPPASG